MLSALKQHRRRSKGKQSNPYSERGLDQFALLSAELQETREKLARKLGTPVALLRFRSSSDQSKWVPIIVRQTSLQSEMPGVGTVSHVSGLQFDEKSVKTLLGEATNADDHGKDAESVTVVETTMTEMPSPSLHVFAPKNTGLFHKFPSAPNTPRASLLTTEPLSPKTLHPERQAEHVSDVKAIKSELGISSLRPSMITFFAKTAWNVSPEELGHALMMTGLVFILGGLVKGCLPAVIGVVCWWYVVASMRQAIRDKPFVRSHHHQHHDHHHCHHHEHVDHHPPHHHQHGQDEETVVVAGNKVKGMHVARVHSSGKDGSISYEHKKKVIMDGLLERRRHKSHS